MSRRAKVSNPFRYPTRAHRRAHGPQGLVRYQAYKQWLRDEFEFRCVYCLTRELWTGGYRLFTIDHVKPKVNYAQLAEEYDNLVYCCAWCNTLKSTRTGFPDPCMTTLGKHLRVCPTDGKFRGLSPVGRRLIEYLKLNTAERVRFRQKYLLYRRSLPPELLLLEFGYPVDLPDLEKLKPPGNSRPEGIKSSHFARREAGKLPLYY